MKKVKLSNVLTVAVLAAVSLTSCQKKELLPAGSNAVSSNEKAPKANSANVARTPYDEGIRSITSLTSGVNASIGYLMYNTSFVNQTPRSFDLGGDAIHSTTSKCYGTAVYNGIAKEAVVYNGADGYARISVAGGLGTNAASGNVSYGGSGVPIMVNNNVTTMRFEEIEINPADGEVYGIVKGASVRLYRIATDGSGTATPLTYNGSYTIFSNTYGNGYKSGSISFVETPAASGIYELAFATESSVYSTLGIVVWRYNVVGNTIVINSAHNTTYAPSLIPGAQTGKINTASVRGQLFFARDNSPMYQLNGTNSVTPIAITPTNVANSTDFGYYKAY